MKSFLREKIDSYLNSDDNRPLVVDVVSMADFEELNQNYTLIVNKNVFDFSKHNEIPSKEDILEYLGSSLDKACFIYGFSTFLKLFGEDEFRNTIHSLLGTTYATKFVVFTYQSRNWLDERVPKYKDKIVLSDSKPDSQASIVLIPKMYANQVDSSLDGLKNAFKKFEKNPGEKIYVTTIYKKKDFNKSIISIEECNSSFDLLCLRDKNCRKLNRNLGTDNEWNELLNKLYNSSIGDTIKQYVVVKNIVSEVKIWAEKNKFEKWLIFIYLKLQEEKTGNWAVDYATDISHSANEFIKNIYWSLLSLDRRQTDFWAKYDVRKNVIKGIQDESLLSQYVNFVANKNEDAIYYLTDSSVSEKKAIIKCISEYHEKYTRTQLISILEKVYKDLYDYLCDYNLGNEFLTSYFNEYRYLKVANYLSEDFKKIVDEEAVKRSFKRILPYRLEKLDDIDLSGNIIAYFVDALGIEFAGYIERKCQEKGLACRVNVCKSYLPSLTIKNSEFRDYFAKKGVEVKDEKELDELKHDGKNDYDYGKTKLPIYIIDEFRVIDKCLDSIRKNLKNQSADKAIIVSDHGATRLAILNTDMLKIDVDDSVGEHGGRVCKEVEGMEPIPNAIIEDGYCILADYNSIKGGRVGKVEMHGGATWEEVTVPLIEITEKTEEVTISVITTVIKVSFRKKAEIKFFSSAKLSSVSIKINGKLYNASTSDYSTFTVELPDITKVGTYKFEVWDNNSLVSSDNSFTVEKESSKTNDLWG